MPWLALLLACGPGPRDETVVDELRVLAVVADPPELGPGETAGVEIHVADPDNDGFEAIAWSCVPVEGRGTCLEDAFDVGDRLALFPDGDPVLTTSVTAPAALGAFLDAGPLAVPVWVLACAPGLCPAIDLARQAPADEPAPEALRALLAAPNDLLGDLPQTGVSLAAWGVTVTDLPQEERALNPILTVGELPRVVEVDAVLEVPIAVDAASEVTAYAYTTGGGFDAPGYPVDPQTGAILTWYAPAEPGAVEVWIVVQDEDGGSAVQHAVIVVR